MPLASCLYPSSSDSDARLWHNSPAFCSGYVAHTEDVEVTDRPHEMMRIANAYALAGLPRLITILEEREGDTALGYLSDIVADMTK